MKERTRCQWGAAAATNADAEAETAEAVEASLRAMARTERWRYKRERRVPMVTLWKHRVRACNDTQGCWTVDSGGAAPLQHQGHETVTAHKETEDG